MLRRALLVSFPSSASAPRVAQPHLAWTFFRLGLWLLAALLVTTLVACGGEQSDSAVDDAAQATADQAADEPPPPPSAEVQAALAQLNAGNAAAAEEILEKAVAEGSTEALALYFLGYAERSQEKWDEAAESFAKALEISPDHGRSKLELARIDVRRGDLEKAMTALEELRVGMRIDLSQVTGDPQLAALRDHADYAERFAALPPTQAEIDAPFVEETKVIHEWRGENPLDEFGWIARDLGDVDGDGVHDVTTSAPGYKDPGIERDEAQPAGGPPISEGKVYVYSGASGELLWSAVGGEAWQLGRGIEAAGDVDADGVPDVVAGGPGADTVRVYDGRDGDVLLEITGEEGEYFGRKVSDVGDLDGDGHDDLLIGAPRNGRNGANAGRAAIHSGKDGSQLVEWLGARAGDAFGSSGAGAVVGEHKFVLVGAPAAGAGEGEEGNANGGRVYVYKGLDAEPAFVLSSDEKSSRFGGMFVSVVGDVDADGMPDLYASDWAHSAKGPQTGKIHVFSGADGREILGIDGEARGDGFGIGPADAGDVDGDGHADLVVGAWQQGNAAPAGGKVYLYSGADGSLLRAWTSRVMGETFGFDATGMGDVDGDGTIDLLLTSGWSPANGARSGRMFVVSSR